MEHVEAVVVGAGLAGLSCAYSLADRGIETIVLERGDYAGAKNVSGGRIYLSLSDYLPELWREAPFERYITRERLTFLSQKRSSTFEFEKSGERQSATVLRGRFDRWFSEVVTEKGALIVPQMVVEDFIYENNEICGIIANGDEMQCDVVVLSDGANSLLAEKSGLRTVSNPQDYAVGIKELIELPEKVINDRFNVREGEGAANLFLGATHGVEGGGFLYTNRESVSLGVVTKISPLMKASLEFHQFIEEFRGLPYLERLLEGGVIAEYSAHLIPEGGFSSMPLLHREHLLVCGDAAGLCLNMGFTVKGMDYAIASGVLAAQAVWEAKKRNDFSSSSLSQYDRLIGDSFIGKDMKSFRNMPRFLGNERMYEFYPHFVCDAFESIFSVKKEKEKLSTTLWREARKLVSLKTARDAIEAVRFL
jgi:electron transfer flavoprotein-quinone oxidoreductase